MVRPRLPDRFHCKEKFFVEAEQIVSNAGYQLAVSLDAMDAQKLAAYKVLYRAYRIHSVKWTFINRYSNMEYNQAVANTGAPLNYGGAITIAYTSKRDISAAPGSYIRAITQNDVKIKVLRSMWSRYERSLAVTDDLDGTEIRYVRSPKLDIVNSADVDHYTATIWAESEGTGNPPFTIIGTMYFTLYDSREEATT